jgi:acyl-CoA synthetase (AMP-forming)/AMP-acid ligase II
MTTTFGSVSDLLAQQAREGTFGRRIAIESPAGAWSYRELHEKARRVAGALRARGLRRGDRVALLVDRHLAAVAGLFGVMAAGGTVCPLEPKLAASDLALRLKRAGVEWLLADRGHATKAREIDLRHTLGLEEALLVAPCAAADLQPDDDALMLFTSGSTGAPKAVLLTHANLLANADGVAERTGVTPEDRLLHAMPIFHTNGVNNQLIVPFSRGACVSFIERFRAETFFEEMVRWHPTYITGVPTMYSRLLAHTPPPAALRTLRFARCGAAPLSQELHRRIEAHLDVPLVVSYGLSEATCTSTMNPPQRCRVGTVGTALDGQRVVVLQPGSDQPLGPGQEGEICIAGAAVMKGYLPEQPAADGPGLVHGWLRTGDLGRLDADGYLSITGRLKDIIIRGGENLSPGLIESALAAHASVKACSVVGAPDADLGEVPVAFVVAQPGHRLDERSLKGEVEQRLSRIHVPARVIGLDALPENAIGKVDRKALMALASTI